MPIAVSSPCCVAWGVVAATFLANTSLVLAAPPVDSVTGRERQAATLHELVEAFDFTFAQILTPEELAQVRDVSPDEIRVRSPELYEKVSQNVRRWTDEWIVYAAQKLEAVPPERLTRAMALAAQVDEKLREYFTSKGWKYRTLGVVFLPQRLLHNPRRRYLTYGGMFIPFYPDVFFSTVDPAAPLGQVLVHESLHLNHGQKRRLGRTLAEGITESGARLLTERWGLLSGAQLLQTGAYEWECAAVDVLANEIARRTDSSHDTGVELLLEAYVTGDHKKVHAIFGAETWERVIELSSAEPWPKRKVLQLLEGAE